MKGVVLAGGLGTRLLPLTKVTNKHLLPVYDKPMVYYPIQTLARAGIDEVMLVTGGNNAGDFLRLLGNGKEFGLKELAYAYQEGHGGIAAALSLAEDFADGERIVVILGDNLIEQDIRAGVEAFAKQKEGAKIYLKEVEHPERFGVPVFEGALPAEGQRPKIVAIEEKPPKPKSQYAVIGIYMYDSRVFDIIRTLEPSGRGELEITDVNNDYLRHSMLTYEILEGWWADAGTSFQSLLRANNLVARKQTDKSG
jgi:glucose-1-phosphate thymidylyltransferase